MRIASPKHKAEAVRKESERYTAVQRRLREEFYKRQGQKGVPVSFRNG